MQESNKIIVNTQWCQRQLTVKAGDRMEQVTVKAGDRMEEVTVKAGDRMEEVTVKAVSTVVLAH